VYNKKTWEKNLLGQAQSEIPNADHRKELMKDSCPHPLIRLRTTTYVVGSPPEPQGAATFKHAFMDASPIRTREQAKANKAPTTTQIDQLIKPILYVIDNATDRETNVLRSHHRPN
jgi:hypothetical protein